MESALSAMAFQNQQLGLMMRYQAEMAQRKMNKLQQQCRQKLQQNSAAYQQVGYYR
jgi:hypothetical protein